MINHHLVDYSSQELHPTHSRGTTGIVPLPMAVLKIGRQASGVGVRGRGIFIFSLCPKGMGVCLVPIENRFRYATGCGWWYNLQIALRTCSNWIVCSGRMRLS